ncbi:uncharacterized protein PHA67_023897 [Liasis olivaceus]
MPEVFCLGAISTDATVTGGNSSETGRRSTRRAFQSSLLAHSYKGARRRTPGDTPEETPAQGGHPTLVGERRLPSCPACSAAPKGTPTRVAFPGESATRERGEGEGASSRPSSPPETAAESPAAAAARGALQDPGRGSQAVAGCRGCSEGAPLPACLRRQPARRRQLPASAALSISPGDAARAADGSTKAENGFRECEDSLLSKDWTYHSIANLYTILPHQQSIALHPSRSSKVMLPCKYIFNIQSFNV